jgi:hypothetical protein
MLSSLWLHSEDTTGAGMPVPAIKRYIDFSLQDFMREVIERRKERKRSSKKKKKKKDCAFFLVVTVEMYPRLERDFVVRKSS